MKWALKALLLGVGVWICLQLLKQVDAEELKRSLGVLGFWAPTVLIPYFGVYLIDAAAWRSCFGAAGIRSIPFATLVRIRWCGESLNNVVPSAYVGGEALKVVLLAQRGIPADQATAAAVISKTVQTLAQLIVLAAAALAFLNLVPSDSPLRGGLLVVMLGSLTVVAGMFYIQRRGIFGTLADLLRRLRIHLAILEQSRPKWQPIDQTIARFYGQERPHFFKGLLLYCLGWLVDSLEVWWFAYLIGHPISWFQALSVEAFVGVAKILGLFVPGALGIQESGILLVGRAVGLSDSFCLAYALVRRAREILFALIGWGLFAWEGIPLKALRMTKRA